MRWIFFLLAVFTIGSNSYGQLFFKGALKANREKTFRNLVQNGINKNLSYPLSDSTEEHWEDAFNTLEVLRYRSLWIDGKIKMAADKLPDQSVSFQRAALELFFSNYPDTFYQPVKLLLMQTQQPKIFAMCANYILQSRRAAEDLNFLAVKTQQLFSTLPDDPILQQLSFAINDRKAPTSLPSILPLLQKSYLPGHTIVFSFQRKNRNYPGLVMVRDASGKFIKDSLGNYFSVPQLARSVNNLPGYLTNGNTPEGIFRMKGYDVSRSNFIGPTVNVQLTMPFEKTPAHFYADSNLTDTVWNLASYQKLLPAALRNYYPLQQSFFAGKAGRTEIIIHGTTVPINWYNKESFYPLTPTMGCLTSKETWDEETGHRAESDQQKLINALIAAGGAKGYAIVINLDDEQRPVLLYDLVPSLEKAGQQ